MSEESQEQNGIPPFGLMKKHNLIIQLSLGLFSKKKSIKDLSIRVFLVRKETKKHLQ